MAASERISQLLPAGTLSPGVDLIPIVNGGSTRSITPQALLNATLIAQFGSFATIAALRASQNVPLVAIVAGYYGPADGGGGIFLLVPTDTISADNGGTIIVTASGARYYRVLQEPTVASVEMFGAVGNGYLAYSNTGTATSDTAAFNRALAWAGTVNGTITCSVKWYYQTGTILQPPNTNFRCTGGPQNAAIIYRQDATYGDTWNMGTASTAMTYGEVDGLTFQHGAGYVNGSTTPLNYPFAAGSQTAHLRVYGSGKVEIKNCSFVRAPFQVVMQGGSVLRLTNCIMGLFSIWDASNTSFQETAASFLAVPDSVFGNPKTVTIDGRTQFFGAISPSRSNALPSGKSATFAAPIGSKYHIALEGCEECHIAPGTYIGDAGLSNLFLYPVSGGYVATVTANGVYFDAAGSANITVLAQSASNPVSQLVVSGCLLNGEEITYNHIQVLPAVTDSGPSLYIATITGNTMVASIGSGGVLIGAVGVAISGNVITDYNCLNLDSTGSLPGYSAAWYVDEYSKFVTIAGDTVGGGGTQFAQTTGGGNYCYNGVIIQDTLSLGLASTCQVIGLINAGVITPGGAAVALPYFAKSFAVGAVTVEDDGLNLVFIVGGVRIAALAKATGNLTIKGTLIQSGSP